MSTPMPVISLNPNPTYKPQPVRPLEEIRADALGLKRVVEGLLAEVFGSGERV